MLICLSSTVLCDNIRCLRKKYGITQIALARLLGIEPYVLRHLEAGKTLPVLCSDVLIRLSEVFAISMEVLTQRNLFEEADSENTRMLL